MAKRTLCAPPADRAAAGQHEPAPTVEVTTLCDLGQHHRCCGSIVSLTAAHGAPCGCACHGGDDLAITAAIERDHDWLGDDLTRPFGEQ